MTHMHGQRVIVERAIVHQMVRLPWVVDRHDIGSAAKGTETEASAQVFAQDGKIGLEGQRGL